MRRFALATMMVVIAAGAQAADVIKIGNLTQLSGPLAAPGSETKRGIDLALEELGNKVGGLPVRYYPVDDKSNPAESVNGASKLIDDLKVDFVTGLGASNTLIPVFKSFVDANIFVVGALAGPRQFAGKECHPNGFFVSFTNDDWPAAAGLYLTHQGYKRVFFIAADYWNKLCRLGALWEQVKEVQEACGRAVALEPTNGDYRDSRGIARALTNDSTGAIDDFTAYAAKYKMDERCWPLWIKKDLAHRVLSAVRSLQAQIDALILPFLNQEIEILHRRLERLRQIQQALVKARIVDQHTRRSVPLRRSLYGRIERGQRRDELIRHPEDFLLSGIQRRRSPRRRRTD